MIRHKSQPDPVTPELRDALPVRAPKPDGWHTYHICTGVLRELTFLGRDGTVSEAMCPNCGEWYRGTVTREGERDA